VIADARVVAIGESAHYNGESYRLRHRLCRYLVERHGFGAYAMESGFVEGWSVDEWVRGGQTALGEVMANGITSLMGLWTEQRVHLEWLREHNRAAARPVRFYGIDLPGSQVSLLPGLDAVAAYLAEADPGYQIDPSIREPLTTFAAPSAFSAPAALAAYGGLTPGARDTLTAGLADLTARVTGRRLEYLRRTGVDAYERTLRSLHLTVALDALARAILRGDQQTAMFNRDAAQADTVEWILRREDRIVVAAHNGHVQRWPGTFPGVAMMTPLGMHLAERLGGAYRVIGTTSGTGRSLNVAPDFYDGVLFADLDAPETGSLDALMAVSHDGPFAVDLRRLSTVDEETVRGATTQRAGIGAFHAGQSPLDAWDVVIHLPTVTAADPDDDALTYAPHDVQKAFTRWKQRA
jgi:erythromycin esterase